MDKPQFSKNDGKRILEELEKVVYFDQSQSSSWPRVTIFVEAGGTDSYQDDSFQIYPNGRTYNVQRSAQAPVPPEVVDALRLCMTSLMMKDATAPTGYASRDVLRFPFRVVDAQSARRHDQWKATLEVLRVIVTKTRKTIQADGKVVHEVIDRYLPDEVIEQAQALLEYVKFEIDQEKAKAAELRQAVA